MSTTIDSLTARITENLKAVDVDARYDEMLDDCYSLASVGGPFASMFASNVLKEVDPIAYRCGKNDWIDGEGFVEIEGSYYDKSEVDDEVEAFADELDSELVELEESRDELADAKREKEDEDEPDTEELNRLTEEIAAKELAIAYKDAEIAAVKAHSF